MAPRHGNGGKAGAGQSNRRGGRGGRGDGSGGKRHERRRERVRDEDGQFVETVDGETVLSVFEAVAGPVVTTTDVSDVLGVSTESARQKLNELVEAGELRRRKTGRTVVYWRVE
ncbi:FaeA/PapI family transcriptional regulator [Halapricum desulfuricans]|nr:FaeA/PapI family transcriptional regulator [Halapricum desulfuricans]